MVIKAEFAELKDIKSTEVKVDREHVVKSICCDAVTGE